MKIIFVRLDKSVNDPGQNPSNSIHPVMMIPRIHNHGMYSIKLIELEFMD